MALLVIGLLLLAAKLTGFGPTGAWPWWAVLLPFGLAVLWWWWADASGWTKRRAMARFDDKRQARRVKNLQALGMGPDGRRKR